MNDYILQTIGLTKKYANMVALDHVDITIQKGRIYGFIGQNELARLRLCDWFPDCLCRTAEILYYLGKHRKKNWKNKESVWGA